MSATIGAMQITLYFEDTFSLKEKRSEVKMISSRISNRFNTAIADIEDLDDMRVATLGVAVLSTDANHASRMLASIQRAIEDLTDRSTVGEVSTELFPF